MSISIVGVRWFFKHVFYRFQALSVLQKCLLIGGESAWVPKICRTRFLPLYRKKHHATLEISKISFIMPSYSTKNFSSCFVQFEFTFMFYLIKIFQNKFDKKQIYQILLKKFFFFKEQRQKIFRSTELRASLSISLKWCAKFVKALVREMFTSSTF